MLRNARIDRYYGTMWSIAASRYCNEYMIGFTARAGSSRLAEYSYNHGYQHLVVLADRLTRAEAHQLEGALQGMVKADKRSVLYRKYDASRRDGRHYPSAGQATSDPTAKVHSVYMAWWEGD